MQTVKISQTDAREVWLEFRRGKATGAKVKGLKPLTRGSDRIAIGFWQLLAEKLAVAPDGEADIDRGHRLENEALHLTAAKYQLELDYDPGMWLSDDSPDIAISPDAAENIKAPTYAAEAKCLSSANHLKYVVRDTQARQAKDYTPFNSIPDDYRDQAIQYFVVNEQLQKLYFTLYDDRIALESYAHHVIILERDKLETEIESQRAMQLLVLEEISKLTAELISKEQHDEQIHVPKPA